MKRSLRARHFTGLMIALQLASCANRPTPQTAPDELGQSMAAFVRALAESERTIRAEPAYGSDLERAGGYLHLMRSMVKAVHEGVFQDRDFPYFRIIDFWSREGGDNPDQRYSFSPIRGGASYRIWGRLGSAKRVELQLYAGEPWAGTGGSAGYFAFEDLQVEPDGRFEVLLSPERPPSARNWLRCPEEATTVFTRQVYDAWSDEDPGEVHIDRVGMEGARKPPATSAELAGRLRHAARVLEQAATVWPAFVQRRYVQARPANTVAPPIDTYALGGVKGRWMSGGTFEVPAGQALVIRTWPTPAQMQGIQLTDLWFASLEYGNRVTSLTATQSLLSPDGAYYTVIAGRDPGHANWLDTGGLERGTFLLRYDGAPGKIDPSLFPSAELVAFDRLPQVIPGFSRVSQAERERTRSERRRHLQVRFDR